MCIRDRDDRMPSPRRRAGRGARRDDPAPGRRPAGRSARGPARGRSPARGIGHDPVGESMRPVHGPTSSSCGRVLLHPPAGRGGGSVDRPHALADRVVADAARRTGTERAQRAAYLARRSVGARRRAVLATLLLVLAVAGWVGAAAGGPVLALGLAPTALLAAVLVLGRRAVLLGRRADADWASGRPAAAHRPAQRVPTAVGHPVRPSEDVTEVMARVAATAATAATAAQPEADVAPATAETSAVTDGPTWVPVPVPRPAYALKPAGSGRRRRLSLIHI